MIEDIRVEALDALDDENLDLEPAPRACAAVFTSLGG